MFPPRYLFASLALVLALGAMTGCAAEGSSGKPQVVASFYPLQYVAERIVGGHAEVSNLTKPGAEPHDLELTPRQTATLTSASVVFHEKGLQPAMDEAIANDRPDHVVDAAEVVGLHHAEDDQAHEDGADHDHQGADPHFWLDPTRLADVGDALAGRLGELDPDGADTYRQNAAALREDLDVLDREMTDGLSGCTVDVLVTSHDAFGYLADRYGFEVVGISGISPSAEPSAEQLARISRLVSERRVTTVYTETLVDPAVAETVASEAGVATAGLDPLEGLTDESDGDDYLAVMRANLATLQEGQSCS